MFYVNTGYEYWGRAAALLHSTVDGRQDLEPTARERIYHLAGAQHFPWRLPRPEDRLGGGEVLHGNPIDQRLYYRALLVRLVEWVDEDRPPPPSRHPRLADGSLVPLADLRLPPLPGLEPPRAAHVAYRADYGPRWRQGIIDRQPPRLGPAFPTLVPAVDDWGNERGGVRGWELRVPLGTFLPWSRRQGLAGGNGELEDFYGTFLPLAPTRAARRPGDPRPSLAERYGSRDGFLAEVREATAALVSEGFLLEEDRPRAEARARELWDAVQGLAAGAGD